MGFYGAGYWAGVARCEHLEREVARLKERVAKLEQRMDTQRYIDFTVERVDGGWDVTPCDCWEYEDWTFGDLEPGDWFEYDGVEWKKVECHYWANARSGDVVDRFFEDEVVYPFEWED